VSDLQEFLDRNVSGYLFGDIQSLIDVPPSGAGGCNYPLLQTVLAGIELLGTLLSDEPFDPYRGGRLCFARFWRERLYPIDVARGQAGEAVYQLARHGLAHCFVAKAPVYVSKSLSNAGAHLHRNADGHVLIDGAVLGADLRNVYEGSVRAELLVKPAARMRFDELQRHFVDVTKHLAALAELPLRLGPVGHVGATGPMHPPGGFKGLKKPDTGF
jgi:hypothetical protein